MLRLVSYENKQDQREAYVDHLLSMTADLERARKEVNSQLGIEQRVPQLAKLAQATEKVGTQLRQWDKMHAQEAANRSDHDKLDDLRTWLGTLPYAYRKNFYERCSIDELAQHKGIPLTVGS